MNDGDFDDGVLNSEWTVVDEYDFHWDGYMEDALRVKQMTTVELDLSSGMTDGETYSIMFYAQLRNEARGATFSGGGLLVVFLGKRVSDVFH